MTFEYDAVLADLQALVAERPDYIYEAPEDRGGCSYSTQEGSGYTPSCGVGWVVSHLDPTLFDAIVEVENIDLSSPSAREVLTEGVNPRPLTGDVVGPGLDSSHPSVILLSTFQGMQDDGSFTWSQALDIALLSVAAGHIFWTHQLNPDAEYFAAYHRGEVTPLTV